MPGAPRRNTGLERTPRDLNAPSDHLWRWRQGKLVGIPAACRFRHPASVWHDQNRRSMLAVENFADAVVHLVGRDPGSTSRAHLPWPTASSSAQRDHHPSAPSHRNVASTPAGPTSLAVVEHASLGTWRHGAEPDRELPDRFQQIRKDVRLEAAAHCQGRYPRPYIRGVDRL